MLDVKFTLPECSINDINNIGFVGLKVFGRKVGHMVGLRFLRRGFEEYSPLGHEAI
jgi:hypothetical protein